MFPLFIYILYVAYIQLEENHLRNLSPPTDLFGRRRGRMFKLLGGDLIFKRTFLLQHVF